MQKKLLTFIAFALLVPMLLGGCFITDMIGKQIGKKIGEKVLEKSTGAKNIDVTDDGVKVETKDGSWATGSSAKLPEDWPSDLPTHNSATIASTYSSEYNGVKTYMVVYTSKTISNDDFINYFLDQFESKGWTKKGDFRSSTGATFSFEKGENTAALSVGTSSGESSATVSAGIKQ